MPNRQYRRGVAFEREIIKMLNGMGYHTLRSAGSHGFADVTACKPGVPVMFIQAKVTSTEASAHRMIDKFGKDPFLPPGPYKQVFMVKVPQKGLYTGEVNATEV